MRRLPALWQTGCEKALVLAVHQQSIVGSAAVNVVVNVVPHVLLELPFVLSFGQGGLNLRVF